MVNGIRVAGALVVGRNLFRHLGRGMADQDPPYAIRGIADQDPPYAIREMADQDPPYAIREMAEQVPPYGIRDDRGARATGGVSPALRDATARPSPAPDRPRHAGPAKLVAG